jgi:hypothetical protein
LTPSHPSSADRRLACSIGRTISPRMTRNPLGARPACRLTARNDFTMIEAPMASRVLEEPLAR